MTQALSPDHDECPYVNCCRRCGLTAWNAAGGQTRVCHPEGVASFTHRRMLSRLLDLAGVRHAWQLGRARAVDPGDRVADNHSTEGDSA